ncbi:DUF3581 family protein [Rheinheimera texasensis]|uniref:DUF3581 family protein n=1 Tax=Rheinheimera texasensis TaxID=306205 RepID=UPI0004E10506|nr:DUF3581 family protein [Rheinheimera texasensis]
MFLDAFVSRQGEQFVFSAEQASQFAKNVAEDFNPIHDADSKRFCVPGDLLFAYLLSRYGLSAELSCRFEGMVGADVLLHCVEQGDEVQIQDQNGKVYLSLTQSGERQQQCHFIEQLVRDYVRFSGQNFPHILQPLMQQHDVMINPQRPLVIYQSMALHFSRFSQQCPSLRLVESTLTQEGKRAQVVLRFELCDGDEVIGVGEKRLVLGSLVPYDAEQMQQMVDFYNQRKQTLGHAA